jgi:hypothetical protein
LVSVSLAKKYKKNAFEVFHKVYFYIVKNTYIKNLFINYFLFINIPFVTYQNKERRVCSSVHHGRTNLAASLRFTLFRFALAPHPVMPSPPAATPRPLPLQVSPLPLCDLCRTPQPPPVDATSATPPTSSPWAPAARLAPRSGAHPR